jgi:hypothetical protein
MRYIEANKAQFLKNSIITMARKYLLTLLSLMTFQANAAWQAIEEDRGFFYDPASVQTMGQRVKVWGLQNYAQSLPLGNRTTMSKKIQIEAECLRTQLRTVSYAFQTEPMGEGETIMGYPLTPASPFGKWRSPEPNSFEQALFNQVCRKPAESPAPQAEPIDPNAPLEIIDETNSKSST